MNTHTQTDGASTPRDPQPQATELTPEFESPLRDIDAKRGLTFHGCQYRPTEDAELVKLAKEAGLPQLLVCCTPATPMIELSPQHAEVLINFLVSSPSFIGDFDENLQCIAETKEGEPLLTGWLSLARFREILAEVERDPALAGHPVQAVIAQLRAETQGWTEAEVDEVYFDGFAFIDAAVDAVDDPKRLEIYVSALAILIASSSHDELGALFAGTTAESAFGQADERERELIREALLQQLCA